MNRTFKAIVVFAGVFLAGAIVGGVATWRVNRSLMQHRMARAEQRFVGQQLRRLSEDLNLSEVQAAAVKSILDRAGVDLRKHREETFNEARLILDRMHADIALLLTAEQKARLEELRKRQGERLKRMMPAPGGPHGEPHGPPPPPGMMHEPGERMPPPPMME